MKNLNIYRYFWLLIFIAVYIPNTISQTSDDDFSTLSDDCLRYIANDNMDEFEKIYPLLYNAYVKQMSPNDKDVIEAGQDSILVNQLFAMRNKDQSIRLLLMKSYRRLGETDGISQKIRQKMKVIDDTNAANVQQIIDKYGWLGKDRIGESGNQTLFLCIQHVDNATVQDKYLPILKDAVEKGNAEPWQFAFLTDRILMNKGEKQIYGTQKIISNEDPTRSYIVPLQDPDNVERLRKDIGLDSLKDDLEGTGIEWDLEEYKKNLPEIEKMYKDRYESLKSKR